MKIANTATWWRLCVPLGCLAATHALANGWAPSPGEIVSRHRRAFEGKSLEHIAGFLVHPSGMVNAAAHEALIAHGDNAVPLLKRMLDDTNPYLSRSAAGILIEMCRRRVELEGRDLTESTRSLMATITSCSIHDSESVRLAALKFLAENGEETAEFIALMVKSAGSAEIAAHVSAARALREDRISDPGIRIEMMSQLYAGGPGLGNKTWSKLGITLLKHRDDPRSRTVVPSLGHFLYYVGNGDPLLRGFFSNGAIARALQMVNHRLDPALEREAPLVARVLCRAHVRLPVCDTTEKYWGESRRLTLEGLGRLTAASAEAVQEAIRVEKEVLAREVNDTASVADRMPEKSRLAKEKEFSVKRKYIAELEAISRKLSEGQP